MPYDSRDVRYGGMPKQRSPTPEDVKPDPSLVGKRSVFYNEVIKTLSYCSPRIRAPSPMRVVSSFARAPGWHGSSAERSAEEDDVDPDTLEARYADGMHI